jgi:hypothetical protein
LEPELYDKIAGEVVGRQSSVVSKTFIRSNS